MTATVPVRTVLAMTTHLMTRRNEVASALIALWVVSGLFLDGWAHNAGKPESFFTPWHGVLYSGVLAGALWGVYERRRLGRLGLPPEPLPPAIVAGAVLFAVAGAGDMLWHQAFGVEEDVDALLSPTHLTLMLAGLLLTTATVRSALARGDRSPRLSQFAPAVAGIALAVAVIGFFLQFESAFKVEDHAFFSSAVDDTMQVHGIVAVLLTNALLLGGVAWTLRHFRPPVGTLTIVLGLPALLLTSLHAFDEVVLVVPALVAGVVADVLVARGRSRLTVLTVTPAVLWSGWFAVYHAVWGMGWVIELWSGSIFFTVLTGWGLSLLTAGETTTAEAPAEDTTAAPPLTPRRAMAEAVM